MITTYIFLRGEKCDHRVKSVVIPQEMVEALKALSTFFVDNSLRSRRNLRGDIEKRSLAINESFESAFREVKQVKKQNWIVLTVWKACTNILHYTLLEM